MGAKIVGLQFLLGHEIQRSTLHKFADLWDTKCSVTSLATLAVLFFAREPTYTFCKASMLQTLNLLINFQQLSLSYILLNYNHVLSCKPAHFHLTPT